MGKHSGHGTNPATGQPSNAISLETPPTADPPMQRYFDDDPAEFDADDLPPLYTEYDQETVPAPNPLIPREEDGMSLQPFHTDKTTSTSYYVDRSLTSDHKVLLNKLMVLATIPPRPFVHIRGTHHETVKQGDKTEKREIVDFDIEIELTTLLYGITGDGQNLNPLTAVGQFEKVRRGTVFATRAPGYGGSGEIEEGALDPEQWCMRFALSEAGLKCFAFERRIEGWSWAELGQKIHHLIRETNYRGHATVEFPVRNARVEIYNDCRTNRWRLTKWIEILFMFTLLFLFSWPWLFFRTKRWETVYAKWRIGKPQSNQTYASSQMNSPSVAEWFNTWGRTINKAIMGRRQCTLDYTDLQRSDGVEEPQEGFAGFVQAGVEAMGVVNRSFGWGGDR